ncbi:ATP-binding protein [Streptomyces sp. H10-C2]|uniref:ATP-binding protein n=1 Tax=unclassified Streptomyces TaxID=2593676 RepID=UPI0024BAB861|nr:MULTISPECIES: ATP-binding protein [unclassified Streptomyces]MDJ0347073.1 ATP-binding protein [Streptomyces sp. PH10-H1]MDJ0374419.1 ATP-binding protein [Streptomyces sp. H10-C2]
MARATVRAVLDAHELPELTDRAQLLSSEMVTNAYLYSDGEARLRLKWCWGVLRLAVWDTSPRPPRLRCAAEDAEYGRGLYLLEVCADRWGHYPIATSLFGTRSKVIWCELAK